MLVIGVTGSFGTGKTTVCQILAGLGATVIDADDANSFVDTISFYRVFNDTSTQATLLWVSEASCNDASCAYTTQEACLRRASNRSGMFTVSPGTYNATTRQFNGNTCFNEGREPDKVAVYYYSGQQSPNNRNCSELDYFWAENIAILATSRLRKPICTCENILRQAQMWQENMAMSTANRTFVVDPLALSNPLGQTVGAFTVWQRIKNRGVKIGKRIKTYN